MTLKITNEVDENLSEVVKYAQKLYTYAQKQLKFNEDASLSFISDGDNAKNILGKTAYYDPSSKGISIYVDNRHPKDILRSFSHELVHHAQNCRGDLSSIQAEDGYAQNDSHLREMEREAYESGNMVFRDWEDNYKFNNTMENKTMSEEKLRVAIRALVEEAVNEARKESEGEKEARLARIKAFKEKGKLDPDQVVKGTGRSFEKSMEMSTGAWGKKKKSKAEKAAEQDAGDEFKDKEEDLDEVIDTSDTVNDSTVVGEPPVEVAPEDGAKPEADEEPNNYIDNTKEWYNSSLFDRLKDKYAK